MSDSTSDLELLKQAVLQQRLRKRMAEFRESEQSVSIPIADRSQPLSVSLAQQRLWFVDQFDKAASAAYGMSSALRLIGRLDVPALQATLDRLVARHESLRTHFMAIDGLPHLQIMSPDTGFLLEFEDLSSLTELERESAVAKLSVAVSRAPFDLAKGPLIRGQLLKLDREEYVLLISQHHIITDGGSEEVMVREVAALYTAFSRGEADPLSPLSIQYTDYAQWQRNCLRGEELDRKIDYWREHLIGAPALLELPLDRLRPAVQSYAGDTLPLVLPQELTAQLRAFSQRLGVTLFMTLLTSWATLLSRLSGQDDVVIGMPVANRQQREVEDLIGFITNTLALRVRFDERPTVATLLKQIKESILSAFEHQDLPFEQVVEALQPERKLSYSPLAQVAFTWNSQAGGRTDNSMLQLPELSLELVDLPQETTQLDVHLLLDDAGDTLSGRLVYGTDLFDRTTIERWVKLFLQLLEAMVVDESARVDSLQLLPEMERQCVLQTFNQTAADYPRDSLFHELFEQQAVAQPDAIAIMYEGERITYGELNARANQLAYYLISQGVAPEVRVAVCVERNANLMVAMLGILKAAGAYLPMDPNYPYDRLAWLLEDGQPGVLLTETSVEAQLPETEYPVLRLDVDLPILARRLSSENPDAHVRGANAFSLAYVMYTSGSTGLPKGVMVEHQGLCNLVHAQSQLFEVGPQSRVLQFASAAFDASISELGMALSSGACLCLVSPDALLPGEPLQATLRDLAITHVTLPSAALTACGEAQFPTLRALIVAGDVCPPGLAQRWQNKLRFYNAYGPTESTVCASVQVCDDCNWHTVPIGRPIANTRVYILDAYAEPVSVGVAGEIYIGGDGVARGYLNRDELTARCFLTDPFSDEPNARMYKTGDSGRWLPDGRIAYLGRNDFQVKIRGFRIELGEIETRLAVCEEVREVVVLAREDVPGDKRLVAYLVAEEGVEFETSSLRQVLATQLPDYMVPNSFVILERFPLTANGKLDRNALPAPDVDALSRREYEAPQGNVEQALAAHWQEMLGVEQVGRHDNFFELGGHSLLVVAMVERLRAMGLKGEVRELFSSPVLHEYAAALTRDDGAGEVDIPANLIGPDTSWITPELLPLVDLTQAEIDCIIETVPGGVANIQDIYPLLPLQEGMLFHYLLETKGDTYLSHDIIAFDSRERLNHFLEVLQQVFSRHDILRTAVLWEGLPKPVQVVYRQATLPITTLSLSGQRDAVTELQKLTDPQIMRLDLRSAPLLAAYLAEDSDRGEWLLSLQIHHIICDHTTFELVLDEVLILLDNEEAELAPSLPLRQLVAKALQISEQDHKCFFRDQLADIDVPVAPFGIFDVQVHSSDLEFVQMMLDSGLSRQLRDFAGQLGLPPAVLFHVAWAQVVGRCSGRSDVVFGTVLSGRLQGATGADRTLGMFINTLPIRVSLDGDVREVLQQSYQRMVALLAHEQAPLVLAQRCSGVPASLPLFTTSLNYRHGKHPDAQNPDNSVNAYGMRLISAARDLANYPLGLKVDDFGDDFAITAVCMTSIGGDRINDYMLSALHSLVDALSKSKQTSLWRMDIQSLNERKQLLEEFNSIKAEPCQTGFVHQIIEAQAAQNPEVRALVFENEQLSYAELNERANQLAHYLIDKGIKPDDRVAICVERGMDLIVALIGTLKAGAAYLPLDPHYPTERLLYMLKDGAPVMLLTHSEIEAQLPSMDVSSLRLDVDFPILSRKLPSNNPEPQALGLTPSHLAYVIYTSGSTGQPKGVMVEHRNLHNMALAHVEHFEVTPESRVLQFVSMAFDVCAAEVFMTLIRGACLCLAARHHLLPGKQLESTLREHAISHVLLPVSVASMCEFSDLPLLQYLIAGGDVCPPALTRRWSGRLNLVNAYGPTETTVCAAAYVCTAVDQECVPIGRPLANTLIYLLGNNELPVPIGVVGEIYIGGAGVARGYLQGAELTAECFLIDPFSAEPAARMYKTGDLGRWLPDGTIEFLGRNDFQVKLRGFRIELGEIEMKLMACAGVCEAVVVVREDQPGDKRLVAYMLSTDNITLEPTALQARLAAELPDYMLPSAYVQLKALPLGVNGKLNREALPPPDLNSVQHREYEPPQGETEAWLATIWQDLLNITQVGRQDNFFELGGHSLMVVGMVDRLQERGLVLAVKDVFLEPTLCELACKVAGHVSETQPLHIVESESISLGCDRITPEMLPLAELKQSEIDAIVESVPGGIANVQDIYGLSPLQEGILFHHMIQEKGDPYASRMVLSFTCSARLDDFLMALQTVIDRHDSLRTSFRWQGLEKPVQVVCRKVQLAVNTMHIPAPVLPQLLEATSLTQLRLDPQRVPVLDAFTAEDPVGQTCYLVLLYHHLIGDHQSMELLVKEADACLYGRQALLPTPLPYRQFIAQSRHLSIQEHDAFFSELLADVVEPTVPFDVFDTHGNGIEVNTSRQNIGSELALRVRKLARRERLSPAVLFHAAWAIAVGRFSGRDDVVFGSVLSGRQGIRGGEQAVGMFINTLPLRLQLGDCSVQQLVRDVAVQLAELLEHEQAPLAWAQRASGVRPPLPLFTALMNYTSNAAQAVDEAAGGGVVNIEMVHIDIHNNYPLTMTVGDQGSDFMLAALTVPGIDGSIVCQCLRTVMHSLLEKLEHDSQYPVVQFPLLSDELELALLKQSRGCVQAYGRELMLPAMIAAQAEQLPDATAVRCGMQSLNYAELDTRANRLAQLLHEQGVGKGVRVGVHLLRSIELLIAQLAVMKTGAAYVPLDPRQPGERLTVMMRDADIIVVLLDSRIMNLSLLGVNTVFVNDAASEADWLSDYPDQALSVDIQFDDTIYVLYTSGSSGEPKGVEVHHGAVIDYCAFALEGYYRPELSGSLVVTSPAFDLSLPGLYLPLLSGGCVELLPEQDELEALSQWLSREQTPGVLLRLTPSHVQALLTLSDETIHQTAHVFVIGGEAFELALACSLQAKFPASQIYNHYGPTETVVGCAWYDVSANLAALDSGIPIGVPMANTVLYVLDGVGRLQAPGVPGELYIGGAGVAKGYLNHVELSAEKFISNPFGVGRLYRSGDKVRWRTDGNLEFMGRMDRQVKLRGFRIELGGIESCLQQNEAVHAAVVRLWGEGEAAQLVAYLVPSEPGETQDKQAAVQAQLQAELPSYMWPAAYVWRETLPLTVNGKVDMQALPVPELSALNSREYEAPHGEIEQTLAELWQELLAVERVSRHDNFQLLGGHSLLMMQLVVRVREKFKVDMSLRKIFETSVLHELADAVVTAQLNQFSDDDVAELEKDLGDLSEEELLSMFKNTDTVVDEQR